jgi:hypothetical protein
MNLFKAMRQRLHAPSSFARRGVAAVEFALTLPIWITLLLGAGDGTYCLLVNEKTDRIAYTVTDIVSQYQNISVANLADIVQAGGQLMQPFSFATTGLIIITSAYKPSGKAPIICWQYKGGGALVRTSGIGSAGGSPNLPNGLVLNDNDNVIISEVFYTFQPLFLSDMMFPAGDIYRTAVYKPRLSPLIASPTGAGGSC